MSRSQPSNLSEIPESAGALLSSFARCAKRANRMTTLTGILQALLTVAFAALVGWIIDDAVYQSGQLWQQPSIWILLSLTIIARGILPSVREWLAEKASQAARQAIRDRLLEQSQALNISLTSRFTPAELSNLLTRELDSLHGYFAGFLPQKQLSVLVPLVILLASSTVSWLVPLVLILTAPLVPLFMILVGKRASAASQKNLKQMNRLGSLLSDRLKGMQTLQLASAISGERGALYEQSESFRKSTMKVLRLAFLSGTLLEFFGAISVAMVAVYLGLFYLDKYDIGLWSDQITLFTGIFLLMLAPEFYLPLRQLGTLYHARADATSVAEHLLELLQQPPLEESAQSTENRELPATIDSISLQDYKVGRASQTAIGPFNVKLTPASTLLLLGPSGAGKSTLLDTLAGLLPAKEGQLLLNEQPFSPFNNPNWFEQVGYMTQRPELLWQSIRHNLCLGIDYSDEQLWKALKMAQVDEVVKLLPGQLDYLISDSGGYLSGGQAQRIALARVFLHQPKLLLLDEPTASLDQETETLFFASLSQYVEMGGVVIMASHRTSHREFFHQVVEVSVAPVEGEKHVSNY